MLNIVVTFALPDCIYASLALDSVELIKPGVLFVPKTPYAEVYSNIMLRQHGPPQELGL